MEKLLSEHPIKSLDIDDKNYPILLKQIPDPPRTLYYRGKFLDQTEKCFAIVGTRKTSDYGKEVAFSFAKQLAEAGLTIVSGMARGIDAFAHKGTLEAGKGCPSQAWEGQPFPICPTIAVLGTGLDEQSIYPQENLKLAKQILEQGGCLISEYPTKVHGDKFTFLQRNRIITGMSLGVLVVEAKIKSGALNTANWAKKQRRKIFAVPGSIYAQNSRGCHFLIQQGAKLAQSPSDILKELGIAGKLLTATSRGANETEIAILNALKTGSQHIDKIIELTKLPPQQVSPALSLMEIEGRVKNIGGNVYVLAN